MRINAVPPYLLLLGLLLVHLVIQWPLLSNDYWNDELYTLSNFVFRSPLGIVTDYHAPNNHVLFSLVMHLWSKCFGINDLREAINHIQWMRFCPFLISIITIFLTYRATDLLAGRWSALFSAAFLITTIPFYNYAAQLRGYGLSMCMAAWLFYAIAVTFKTRQGIVGFVQIAASIALCLYTLPSNIYFVISIGASLFIAWAVIRRSFPSFSLHFVALVLISIVAGTLMAGLLYLPVLPQLQKLFTSNSTEPYDPLLLTASPLIAYHFFSGRYLLLLLVPISGTALFLKQPRVAALVVCTLVLLFFLPFLLSDLRHSNAPYRIFLTPLPLLAGGIGILIGRSISFISQKMWQNSAAVSLCIYCTIIVFSQVEKARAQVLRDMQLGRRTGDLYFQFNLHYFNPYKDATTYMHTFANPRIPLLEACRMDAELLKYLSMAGWDRGTANSTTLQTALAISDSVDVLTEKPAAIQDSLKAMGIARKPIVLLNGPRQVQIVRLLK